MAVLRICLAGALLLAACGGGSAPTLAPATSPTPPASASASPLDTSGAFAGAFDIGQRSLWATCTERVAGGLTVVLEHGGGASHAVWSDVTAELADVVRVCTYDRAGDGRSDPIGPHTAGDQADDLHALLVAAGIETPVVLVGHSLPGLMLRLYPDRYPDDVAGLVFLDPLVPRIEELQLAALPQPTAEEPEALTRYRELLVKLIEENDDALPEYDNFLFNDSHAQAAAIRTLGDLPLVVVTAERDNWIGGSADDPAVQAVDAILMAVQRDEHEALAGLSSAGEHRTTASGHELPRDQPQVVVDVVLDLLSELGQR